MASLITFSNITVSSLLNIKGRFYVACTLMRVNTRRSDVCNKGTLIELPTVCKRLVKDIQELVGAKMSDRVGINTSKIQKHLSGYTNMTK